MFFVSGWMDEVSCGRSLVEVPVRRRFRMLFTVEEMFWRILEGVFAFSSKEFITSLGVVGRWKVTFGFGDSNGSTSIEAWENKHLLIWVGELGEDGSTLLEWKRS